MEQEIKMGQNTYYKKVCKISMKIYVIGSSLVKLQILSMQLQYGKILWQVRSWEF